jgi:hypothetical protein
VAGILSFTLAKAPMDQASLTACSVAALAVAVGARSAPRPGAGCTHSLFCRAERPRAQCRWAVLCATGMAARHAQVRRMALKMDAPGEAAAVTRAAVLVARRAITSRNIG